MKYLSFSLFMHWDKLISFLNSAIFEGISFNERLLKSKSFYLITKYYALIKDFLLFNSIKLCLKIVMIQKIWYREGTLSFMNQQKCLTKEKLSLFYIKSWLLTLIHFPREGEAKWTAGIFCFITHANFIKLVDFS